MGARNAKPALQNWSGTLRGLLSASGIASRGRPSRSMPFDGGMDPQTPRGVKPHHEGGGGSRAAPPVTQVLHTRTPRPCPCGNVRRCDAIHPNPAKRCWSYVQSVNRALGCTFIEPGFVGPRAFNWGGGGGSPPPPQKKRAQLTGPPKSYRDGPRAPEVTQTQKSGKRENGIFGISTSRGFRKVIICHVLGVKNLTIFNAQKSLRRLWRQSSQ